MIDHASADLWVVSHGAKSFEDPSLLDTRLRNRLQAINGVAEAAPVVIGFAVWQLPGGGMTPVFVVGTDVKGGGLVPWNIVAGSLDALTESRTVAASVRVAAVTQGIRSFTTTPYRVLRDRSRPKPK